MPRPEVVLGEGRGPLTRADRPEDIRGVMDSFLSAAMDDERSVIVWRYKDLYNYIAALEENLDRAIWYRNEIERAVYQQYNSEEFGRVYEANKTADTIRNLRHRLHETGVWYPQAETDWGKL